MLVLRMNNSTNTFAPIGDRSMVIALRIGRVLWSPPSPPQFSMVLTRVNFKTLFLFCVQVILKFLKSFQDHKDPQMRRAERMDNVWKLFVNEREIRNGVGTFSLPFLLQFVLSYFVSFSQIFGEVKRRELLPEFLPHSEINTLHLVS